MVKYKSKTKDNQLIVKARLSCGEEVNERALEFVSAKSSCGLLRAKIIKRFGRTTIEYTGPNGISLYEWIKKPVSKYNFFLIMEQIVDIVQKIEPKRISLNKIVWDIHQVYINENTTELMFLYLPLENGNEKAELMEFIMEIIYSAEFSQNQDTNFVIEFKYFLERLREFDSEKIEQFIANEDRKIVSMIKGEDIRPELSDYEQFDTDKESSLKNRETEIMEAEQNEPETYRETEIKEAEQNEPETYRETEIMETEQNEPETYRETEIMANNTICFRENMQIRPPFLYRVKTKEIISVSKRLFQIGREERCADYIVKNNPFVSRNHANIVNRGARYFLVDLESTYGTFINDLSIPPKQEEEIVDGDKFRLADEEFIFHC